MENYNDKAIIGATLKDFIVNLTGVRDISPTTRLIDEGIVDSLHFVELVIYIESKFRIKINALNVHSEDFESLDTLSEYIIKKAKK